MTRTASDLARLSEIALGSGSIWTLAETAVEIVNRVLEAEATLIAEQVGPDRIRCLSSFGLEWQRGSEPISVAPDSQAAFVLASPGPVVCTDLVAETRFEPARLLLDLGVRSTATMPLIAGAHCLGLLGVYHREPSQFCDDRLDLLRTVAALVTAGIERRREQVAAEFSARHDPLTGLMNRRSLLESLEWLVSAGDATVGVTRLGLDGFAQVNEQHGHLVGDAVLKTISDRLEQFGRGVDLVARLSGDEFVVASPGQTIADASRNAEHMIGEIERAITAMGVTIELSASCGVLVTSMHHHVSTTELLAVAGRAMQRAKQAGRGQVRVASAEAVGTPADVCPSTPFGLVDVEGSELDDAIDGIRVVFQTIVRGADHAVVGVEALARGPVGSRLERPDRLFAAADAAGRLEEVELAAKHAAFSVPIPDGVALFMNIDPAVLTSPEWLALLVEVWRDAGSPKPIVAELTERSLLASPRSVLEAVERCREIGWKIALDDVGARAESLAALRVVRPDVIKLDMSLISTENRIHAAGVSSAVATYAQRSDVTVIAEGVETLDDEMAAGVLGATLLQGYRFSRPTVIGDVRLDHTVPITPETTGRFLWPQLATKQQLVDLSRFIESTALSADTIVVAAMQDARHFTDRTRRHYQVLARRCGMVGVIGRGLGTETVDGVRRGEIADHDELDKQWNVVVLTPNGGIGLLAEEIGGGARPDQDRLFSFRLTSDAAELEAVARRLMHRFDTAQFPSLV